MIKKTKNLALPLSYFRDDEAEDLPLFLSIAAAANQARMTLFLLFFSFLEIKQRVNAARPYLTKKMKIVS